MFTKGFIASGAQITTQASLATFDIQYMYQERENNYLNKVSTCYLESMDVDYGGDRFYTHTPDEVGAPPVETTITLQFGEIDLITREKAIDGF